jgi:predicted RNase H-like HicB family nuclease
MRQFIVCFTSVCNAHARQAPACLEEEATAMQHVDVEAKAREYTVEVAWSEEYQRFIATMPEWGFAVTDGKTPEEALRHARACIEMAIVRCLQKGRLLPIPHTFAQSAADLLK